MMLGEVVGWSSDVRWGGRLAGRVILGEVVGWLAE